MKNYAHTIRYSLIGLALLSTLFIGGAQLSVSAQKAGKEKASSKIRGPRDPFVPYVVPVKRKRPVNVAAPIPVPSIEERIAKYKAQKLEAMNKQEAAPKPTTALVLSEMQVTGIFRTPRGYAAMVEATPIKLSYVIYPGETFFDGQLVAIEEDQLVFRHETRWTDGRIEKAVETKPLRQSNGVMDSLTVSRTATGNGNGAADATPANGDSQAPTPEK